MISREWMPCGRTCAVGRRSGVLGLILALDLARCHAALEAGPRTPADELASFVLADPDLRVELVAAEPAITSPVAVAWDAGGSMFVAEMNDYPTATSGGRIRRLTDSEGDGVYEAATTFVEDLHFPSGVQPWRDGILVSAAPDILFFRDTDGDGRANERRVVFSGFAEGNQQLRVNGLTWAPDGWIYGANGRSDGEIRGGALTSPLSLRRHDFRFRPDTGVAEVLAGPSQFGIAFDAGGHRFLSWNTIPIRHEVIPERYAVEGGGMGPVPNLEDCLDRSDTGQVFPLAPPPQTFNRESTRHFNALAGLHLYGGDALGAAYVGSAFVGETLRSLVHRRVLEPNGATFVARRGPLEAQREFLAASDPWFHPVNFATGPDGALYVCDFYRRWVEHPGFVPESLRAQHDWREGWDHGRIWRIVSRRVESLRTRTSGSDRRSGIASVTNARLVDLLGDPNAWKRLTAQRLLAEQGALSPSSVRALRSMVGRTRRSDGIGRLHALRALENAGSVDDGILKDAWGDSDSRVRRAALQLAEARWIRSVGASLEPSLQVRLLGREMVKLAKDPDASVRLQLALSARWLPEIDRIEVLSRLLDADAKDPWITRAALLSGREVAGELARRLLTRVEPEKLEILYQLGLQTGWGPEPPSPWPPALVADDAGADRARKPLDGGAISLAAGYLEGRQRANAAATLANVEGRGGYRERAGWILESSGAPAVARVHAFRLLAYHTSPGDRGRFLEYLGTGEPMALQLAVVEGLSTSADAALAAALYAQAPRMTVAARRRLLALAARNPETASALLEAAAKGAVPMAELDPGVRAALQKHPQPAIQAKAAALFTTSVAVDRDQVVAVYRKALEGVKPGQGNRQAGAALFAQNCSVCHRLGDRGVAIGPDLAGIGSRPTEALLVDLIDPSRQVAPDYLAYEVTTQDGEERSGLLVSETPDGITLRRPNLADETIPRARIRSVRASEKSLMPEGFETLIGAETLPDLLAFLADPVPELLPKP